MTKQGQLRVYHIANGVIYHQEEVDTIDQAMKMINEWAEIDLRNPLIEFNAFGLEEYDTEYTDEETGEHWCEWYNEYGEDIMEIMDNLEEQEC